MRIGLLTQVRLLEEAVIQALGAGDPLMRADCFRSLARVASDDRKADPLRLLIVDTTGRIDLDEVRRFHSDHPELPLMALGLTEREHEVIAHASAGFSFYLRREDGFAALREAVHNATEGRLSCAPEISAAIMRALFRAEPQNVPQPDARLTPREAQIAELVRRGFSNKEIARAYDLSESTVKHHVHRVLAKYGLATRMQLMRAAQQGLAA